MLHWLNVSQKLIKTIDDPEDLDLAMLMNKLIEYSSNYSETTGSLWFILKIKRLILMLILLIMMIILNLLNIRLNKVLENPVADEANRILRNTKIAVPLKYLSNF